MNILKPHPCPNCQKALLPDDLIKKKVKVKLPWYGITPAPNQHCPQCDTAVHLVGWHRGWLGLTAFCLTLLVINMFITWSNLSEIVENIIQFIVAAIAVTALLISQRYTHYERA